MLPELLDFSKVAQNCAHRSKIKMKAPFAFVAGESGPVQTPNFSWAEPNTLKVSWKVRRLKKLETRISMWDGSAVLPD